MPSPHQPVASSTCAPHTKAHRPSPQWARPRCPKLCRGKRTARGWTRAPSSAASGACWPWPPSRVGWCPSDQTGGRVAFVLPTMTGCCRLLLQLLLRHGFLVLLVLEQVDLLKVGLGIVLLRDRHLLTLKHVGASTVLELVVGPTVHRKLGCQCFLQGPGPPGPSTTAPPGEVAAP